MRVPAIIFVAAVSAACNTDEECVPMSVDPIDLAATPRADGRAELLALLLGDAPVARGADFDRVVTDLAAIAAVDPTLSSTPVLADVVTGRVDFSVDAQDAVRVRDDPPSELIRMNEHYGVTRMDVSEPFHEWASVTLELTGLFRGPVFDRDYACLGLVRGPPIPPDGRPQLEDTCAERDGDTSVYWFWNHSCFWDDPDCDTAVDRVETRGPGAIERRDTYRGPSADVPSWTDPLIDCLERKRLPWPNDGRRVL